MKFLKKKATWVLGGIITPVGVLVAPSMLFAQATFSITHTEYSGISAPVTSVQGLINLLCKAFDYMFYFLIALSIIMGLVAAFNYVTAGDNAEKVSKANKIILYAAIGVAIALLAKGIPLIVGSFFNVSSGLNSC